MRLPGYLFAGFLSSALQQITDERGLLRCVGLSPAAAVDQLSAGLAEQGATDFLSSAVPVCRVISS
jgi:hypothetical protein